MSKQWITGIFFLHLAYDGWSSASNDHWLSASALIDLLFNEPFDKLFDEVS